MRVWVINAGEPLPIDGEHSRLVRGGIQATTLAAMGWDVVWWHTDFDHTRKRHRTRSDAVVDLRPNLRLHLVGSIGYRRNVSLRRIVDHYQVGRRWARLALDEPKPDLIVVHLPPVDLALEATRYGRKHGVPVIVDAQDYWPDVFLDIVPKFLQPLGRVMLKPLFTRTHRACRSATALIGHSQMAVDWAVASARREHTSLDRYFPFGYTSTEPPPAALAVAGKFWDSLDIRAERDQFVVTYIGSLGRLFDAETLVGAASRIEKTGRRILFVICGDGERAESFREMTAGLSNVVFPGWIHAHQIWTLMRRSSVGLMLYRDLDSFRSAIQNKTIEYLSAGLPVVSGVSGLTAELLGTYGCGLTYPAGDSEALANHITHLHDNPAELTAMAANASHVYREHFVAEKIYAQMARFFEDIVRNSDGVPGTSQSGGDTLGNA